MKKYIIALVAIPLILLTSCAPESNDIYVSNDTYVSADEMTAVEAIITIQELFEPKDSVIYIEGEPVSIKLYPFGEIIEDEEKASFVIFVEAYPRHRVEQQDNLLRLTSNFDPPMGSPPIFMEITQIVDITVDEAERQIKSDVDLVSHELFQNHATEDFPFNSIHLYERELSWNAKVVSIYIKDNDRGGVFVITAQHSEEAYLVGARFRHYISTMEIIDK